MHYYILSLKNIIWVYRVYILSYGSSPSFGNMRINNYFTSCPIQQIEMITYRLLYILLENPIQNRLINPRYYRLPFIPSPSFWPNTQFSCILWVLNNIEEKTPIFLHTVHCLKGNKIPHEKNQRWSSLLIQPMHNFFFFSIHPSTHFKYCILQAGKH